MMNYSITSLALILILLVTVVSFTCGQKTYDYQALRCFVCTGPQAPLCDGDDKQQYGVKDVKCSSDLPASGQITYVEETPTQDRSLILTKDTDLPFPVVKPRAEFTYIYDSLLSWYNKLQRDGIPMLYEHNGEHILVKDGLSCWIMKVEYTAHGKIEVYKGCHENMGDEFARIWQKEFKSRSIHSGYCETFRSQPLVGEDDGKRFYYSHVTVCFCNTHNCNEKTLPHFEKNGTMVGLEDVEQRRWMKKRKGKGKKNSSETLNKSQKVTVALLTIFGFALAVYLIRIRG